MFNISLLINILRFPCCDALNEQSHRNNFTLKRHINIIYIKKMSIFSEGSFV